MDNQTMFFSATILFLAYTVRGVAGFGSALIAVPLLTMRFPLTMVVPLVVLLDYLGSATQGFANRMEISWRDVLPLIPFTLIGVFGALLVMEMVDPQFLTTALGGFVLLYAVYQLSPLPEMRASRAASIPTGLFGGLMGTLFGTGGPFYVMYFNMRSLDKTVMRASFATYFLVDGSMRLAGYTLFGHVNKEMLLYMLAALPIAGFGLLVGGQIHLNLSQQTFKRFISLLLLGSGIALILKG